MKKEYTQNIISKQRKINRPFRPNRPIHAKENVSRQAELGKYCITQDYKSDTQISQNCLKKISFSAAKMLHRLLQPVSRETFFVVIYRIAAVFTALFCCLFSVFFRLYGKFFLAMEQKELLVIVNGNYQRIVSCRSFFRPNRPKKRLR